jgi:hypothetical protein
VWVLLHWGGVGYYITEAIIFDGKRIGPEKGDGANAD